MNNGLFLGGESRDQCQNQGFMGEKNIHFLPQKGESSTPTLFSPHTQCNMFSLSFHIAKCRALKAGFGQVKEE